LLTLSEVLDKEVQFFLDPFSVVAEAQYCWRASPELPGSVLDRFEERASGWVGLLRWLRNEHKVAAAPLKPVLRLTANSPYERAQFFAEKLVEAYELGPVPAEKLVEFIDGTLDIPVLFVDTGEGQNTGSISGAACDLGELGVVLVNRNEPATRRYFDLAHEFFHTLTWEAMKPAHRESNSVADRKGAHRIEQLANSFAAALLMPTSSLDTFIEPARVADARHLAEVAAKLRVSTEALGWRLLQLGRIDTKTRTALAAVRLSGAKEETPRPFSKTFVAMLHTALDRGWLTARKAATAMGMTLGELKELFAAHDMKSPFDL
jgi:Zn-dependent peptidase ImmA (M78 family)